MRTTPTTALEIILILLHINIHRQAKPVTYKLMRSKTSNATELRTNIKVGQKTQERYPSIHCIEYRDGSSKKKKRLGRCI